MSDQGLSVRERMRSADYRAWLPREANKAAAWLSEQGCETEADKAELAAVHLMAALALLERGQPPSSPRPASRIWCTT